MRQLLVREHLAALVLARRIADFGRAAAHDDNRPVSCLLNPAQQHDRRKVADMKRWCSRVEANIGRDDFFACQRIQPGRVGHLVNMPAFFEQAEQGQEASEADEDVGRRGAPVVDALRERPGQGRAEHQKAQDEDDEDDKDIKDFEDEEEDEDED